jgi:hypothetical protein
MPSISSIPSAFLILDGSIQNKDSDLRNKSLSAVFLQAIPMTGMAGDILPMEAPRHPSLK